MIQAFALLSLMIKRHTCILPLQTLHYLPFHVALEFAAHSATTKNKKKKQSSRLTKGLGHTVLYTQELNIMVILLFDDEINSK